METKSETSTTRQRDVEAKGEGDNNKKDDDTNKDDTPSPGTSGSFECNICLDQAKDAVVSKCGHLFCWPCLHQWLETRPNNKICPVCKAAISKDSVIPLYGRGGDHKEDPRLKVPPRPQGQRIEPQTNRSAFSDFFNPMVGARTGNNNFQMSIGVGAFPFGLFTTSLNFGSGGQNTEANSEENPGDAATTIDAENLSKLFLGMAFFFIIWLLVS